MGDDCEQNTYMYVISDDHPGYAGYDNLES